MARHTAKPGRVQPPVHVADPRRFGVDPARRFGKLARTRREEKRRTAAQVGRLPETVQGVARTLNRGEPLR